MYIFYHRLNKRLDLKRKQQKIAEARHKAGKCSEIGLKKAWLETTAAENRLIIGKIEAELARLDLMLCSVEL